jgi:hypothetical protein
MDWTQLLDSDRWAGDVVVALAVALAFTVVFGASRRIVPVAIAFCVCVDLLYPGGSTALVADTLRPLRAIEDAAVDRAAEHNAALVGAGGETPAATTR